MAGRRSRSVVTLAVAAMLPIVALLMPESPAQIGLAPFGAATVVRPPPAAGQPGHRRHGGLVARRAVSGLLAAHFELRDLRVLDGSDSESLPSRPTA
jgi:hypothetical protein